MPVTKQNGQEVFARVREHWALVRKSWVHGFETSEAELAPLSRRADALLGAERLPDEIDLDVLAAAECMLMNAKSLVWPVTDHAGAREALAMKARSIGMQVQTKTKQGEGWWCELAPGRAAFVAIGLEPFSELRAAICSANEKAYARARVEGIAIRNTGVESRMLVDFCFPSEPAWANEDMEAALGAKDFTQRERMRAGLLASTNDAPLALRWIERASGWTTAAFACDLVFGFDPETAWPLLEALSTQVRATNPRQRPHLGVLARAVASLHGEAPARAFAPLLLERTTGPVAARYFRQHRDLAERVLPEIASQKNLVADVAGRILYGHRAQRTDTGSTPPLLADPPWHRISEPEVLTLPALEFTPRVVWSKSERQVWLDLMKNVIPMTAAEKQEWEALPLLHRCVDAWAKWVNGTWSVWGVPDAISLALWNGQPELRTHFGQLCMIARHGDAAIPGLLARNQFESVLHVDSPTIAPQCARALERKRMSRRAGRAWLLAHPETAAIGLVPLALGPAGKDRRAADLALSMLASKGHAELVLEVAKRWGEPAHAAMRLRLERDPLAEIHLATARPVPSRELPRPKLRDGSTLSELGFARLLEMLRGASPVVPYAGFAVVREELDPESLGELARALFEIWLLAPGVDAESWMAWSLVWIGNDASTRSFLRWARDRAQRSDARSDLVIRILAAIGTETALLELALLARETRFNAIQTEAELVLTEIAAERGITREDLNDQTIPTLDLDTDPMLDLGSRQFRLVVSDGLQPLAVTGDGKRLHQLPRASESDDAEKARVAAERWRSLSATLQTIERIEVPRLERAMIRGRRWNAADFDRWIAKHPVVSVLARRLVWSTGFITFRVVEDGTFADETDERIELDPQSEVHLPHPLNLTEEGKTIWGQLFADYAIVQPFEQIGRTIHTLPQGELAGSRSKRITGRTLSAHKLLQIADAYGWQRPAPNAMIGQLWRLVRSKTGKELRVWLQVSPGFWLWKIDKDQMLGDLMVTSATFGDIHPVDLSEIIRDVDAFT